MILLWRAFQTIHCFQAAPSAFTHGCSKWSHWCCEELKHFPWHKHRLTPHPPLPRLQMASGPRCVRGQWAFSINCKLKLCDEWRENRPGTGKQWLLILLSGVASSCWNERTFTTGSSAGVHLSSWQNESFLPGGLPSIFLMPTNCHFPSSVFLIFSFLNYLWEVPLVLFNEHFLPTLRSWTRATSSAVPSVQFSSLISTWCSVREMRLLFKLLARKWKTWIQWCHSFLAIEI